MQSKAVTVEEYLANLPDDRKDVITQLHKTILKNLPKGFLPVISYGMISYVVPHTIYPGGYHCNTSEPLPFISLASQKNHIALYHMGIYGDPVTLEWFQKEFAKASTRKLDMGKSCIRFKKPEDIPMELMGKLAARMTPKQWISIYESNLKQSSKK